MKKALYLLLFAVVCSSAAHAQDYKWGVGIKAGTGVTGLNVKHFFDSTNAIDGTISGNYDGGVLINALYERHVPIIGNGFRLYYGGGGHIYTWNKGTQIGIDGIVGLEYKIPQVPIAMSIDFKPEINFIDRAGFNANTLSFGVKYTF